MMPVILGKVFLHVSLGVFAAYSIFNDVSFEYAAAALMFLGCLLYYSWHSLDTKILVCGARQDDMSSLVRILPILLTISICSAQIASSWSLVTANRITNVLEAVYLFGVVLLLKGGWIYIVVETLFSAKLLSIQSKRAWAVLAILFFSIAASFPAEGQDRSIFLVALTGLLLMFVAFCYPRKHVMES
ncbi:hypothetical protein ACI2KR_09135 [Pseudomonas luteola]